jgi:hypothetical protein
MRVFCTLAEGLCAAARALLFILSGIVFRGFFGCGRFRENQLTVGDNAAGVGQSRSIFREEAADDHFLTDLQRIARQPARSSPLGLPSSSSQLTTAPEASGTSR